MHILTSFALHNVLQWLGCNSRPLRIEAAVFPDDQKLSVERASISATLFCLLDQVLDPAATHLRRARVSPLAIRLSENFWAERGSILVRTNGCEV